MNAFFNGLMISGSLIIAIGAQNAFVLKQGLLKQNTGIVVLLCWLCDVVLMGCGIFGVALLLSDNTRAAAWLSLAGGVFLLVYGMLSLKRAWRGGGHMNVSAAAATPVSAYKTAATTLALTLLNPHVYVDTVMLIGGSAARFGQAGKISFFIGAIMASGIWFAGIGYGSRLLLPLFSRERVWQILDGLIAVMMFYLAYGLLKSAWLTLFPA
ncbi:LysE family transporter [Uruburuella testudinis]|uniref:LysE family transporter n=1 Tax=Uruburuella testudinis TaxID=1282863 RepID=A0ABY4DQU4_9NEIS|nr:LysE family transporter [Uruburuella testudinis]UOO80743.1 LysE family transporter [Uruburuella testudinis]